MIAAQAFVFFLAGFETSSTTLSFCLHELAVNMDVQKDLRREVEGVAQKYGLPLTYDGLKDLVLLEQCLLGNQFHNFYLILTNFVGFIIFVTADIGIIEKHKFRFLILNISAMKLN